MYFWKWILVFLFIGNISGQDVTCPAPNGYFPDRQFCDRFLECRNNTGHWQTCPDGLIVNEQAAAFRYPCDYPVDVDCGTRTPSQPPQPTGNCPRKWGMFGVGDSTHCGQFINCVDGKDFLFNCPEGLAWHPTLWRCEWADQVPTCNAEAFLGFKCPIDPALGDIGADTRFPHPRDCARFFVCIGGKLPRLNICPERTVYNPTISGCDEPANVPGCENYYPPIPKRAD